MEEQKKELSSIQLYQALEAEPNLTLEKIQEITGADKPGSTVMKMAIEILTMKYRTQTEVLNKLKTLYKVLELVYPNRATLATRLGNLRPYIRRHQKPRIYDLALTDQYFNIPQAEIMAKKLNYKKQVIQQNMNLEPIPEGIIKSAIEYLESDDRYKKAIALLLFTGSRPVELLNTGVYQPIPNDEQHLIISGIAKKREGNTRLTVTRPIIGVTASKALEEINRLRESFASYKLLDKNNQLASNVVRGLMKQAQELGVRTYTLRKIYSRLAYEQYGQNQNYNIFITQILGHEDITTSFSYSTMAHYGIQEQKEEKESKESKTRTEKGYEYYAEKYPERIKRLDFIVGNTPDISPNMLYRATRYNRPMIAAYLKHKGLR